MFEEEIQRKISDFIQFGIPPFVPREGIVHMAKNSVSTIIGARRAGKSYRAIQASVELVKQGKLPSIKHVCPLDFDNPILSEMKAKDLKIISTTFLKMNPEFTLNTPIVFILDEVHKIPGWEEGIVELSRNPNWTVIVTGSSSKFLRDEIATELRGKAISSTIYPLSFREYLLFKGATDLTESTKDRAEAIRHFENYLMWGSYPAIANADEISKTALLREYYNTMLLRDVIERYEVSKPKVCVKLLGYLLSNISRPMTLKGAYDFLKENNFVTSRNALMDYIQWASFAWLLYLIPVFSQSHKEQERNYKKVYCIDSALASQNSPVWDGSKSRMFENIIFMHLLRKFQRVNFYITRSARQEVDFVAADRYGNPCLAAQACMDISQKETLKRKLVPLITTAKYFGIKENLIITLNQENRFEEDGITVNAVPVWRWLKQQHPSVD